MSAEAGSGKESGKVNTPYTLERLLDVAVAVFTERGYDGTSFQHLSQASGLSKSSLYHHIESKEQLLRLSLERALEPLMASLGDERATSGRAIDRLRHLIESNLEIMAERMPYVTLLLSVRGNTETERWALDERRSYDRAVAAVVREAIADGDLRSDIEPGIVARLIFGSTNSIREWYRPGPGLSPAELGEQLISLLMNGVRAR